MIGELSRPLAACVVVAAMLAGCNESASPKAASPDDTTPQSQVQEATATPPSSTAIAPSTTVTAPSTSPRVSVRRCTNATALRQWNLHRLARQTVTVPVEESDVGAVSAEVASGVGGVILFGSEAPTDLGSSLHALVKQAPNGIRPFVMTDEEGGAVERMANLVGHLPSARELGATMRPRQIRHLVKGVAAKMRAARVTMDLAPVLDLDNRPGPSDTNPDGTRSFSIHHKKAAADGLAFARGLQDSGVIPVVKHFPGLGGATANPDVAKAYTKPWRVLKHNDVLPFAAAIAHDLPAVMVSDAIVPGLSKLPAALAPAVVNGALRTKLGFHGLVITDSLSATAISVAGYSVPVQALRR